jgi:hypothetical protein
MTNGARRVVVLCTAAVTFSGTLTMSSVAFAGTPSGVASARAVAGITWDTAREVSETTRLADRRSLTNGDRMYVMGDESGLYPAAGWHIRGEMGGFWTPPVKLLDGVWFRIADNWLSAQIPTTQYTRGFGYERYRFQQLGGLSVERVNFVPDGARAAVIGLTLRSNSARTVPIAMDAHSELLPAYPWGWTTPNASINLPDTGSYADGTLVFRETGTPPVPNATPHDYAAVLGSTLAPTGNELGADYRGPQDPAVICPTDGPAPYRCDDSGFGKGTGGQLRYRVQLTAGRPTTVWFVVAGSDKGLGDARSEYAKAAANPAGLLQAKIASRLADAARSTVDLPGDRLLQSSVEWSKQNLADSILEARNLQIRDVDEGRAYPPIDGVVPFARWSAAGFPDYPWIFGTDGEYTAFANVAAGQFDVVRTHLRALRDVSDLMNDRSGKVVHEVTPTGDVYFGSNTSPGNTDETAKFPSAVALLWRWTGDNAFRDEMYDFTVRNMQYIYRVLDADGDGWPEGLGNVERAGMGVEKLDSTVYTIRGLRDLADMATSKGDTATASWANGKAADLESRFEAQWWYGGDANAYADSVDDPANPANDNTKIFQRHWIGVTPMEAVLTLPDGTTRPLASLEHGNIGLDQRELPCYTHPNGMYHTGTGPTSAPSGNPGPSCDSVVSAVGSERSIFGLNTSIIAVGEGNFGRMGPDQQQHYTTANARIQLDPSLWETPGAMPEIAPSPDFTANIDRAFVDRSMNLQAWGTYGVLWPVIAQQLGVTPALGHGRLAVVPQLPDGQNSIAGSDIRLGGGSLDVSASRAAGVLSTTVAATGLASVAFTLGAVLPDGASVASVLLDGAPAPFVLVQTTRGTEVRVAAGAATGTHTLTIELG